MAHAPAPADGAHTRLSRSGLRLYTPAPEAIQGASTGASCKRSPGASEPIKGYRRPLETLPAQGLPPQWSGLEGLDPDESSSVVVADPQSRGSHGLVDIDAANVGLGWKK